MNHKINISCKLSVVAVLFSLTGCTRDINTDVLATYPHLSDVLSMNLHPTCNTRHGEK